MATGWESTVKSDQKHVTGRPVAQLIQRAFPCCGSPGFETHLWSFAQCHLPSQSSHSLSPLKLSCQYSHEKGRKKSFKSLRYLPKIWFKKFFPPTGYMSPTQAPTSFTFSLSLLILCIIAWCPPFPWLHRSPSTAAPNQLKLSWISTVRSRQCKYTIGWYVCAATKPTIGFLGDGRGMCHTTAISSVIDFSNKNASGGLSPLLYRLCDTLFHESGALELKAVFASSELTLWNMKRQTVSRAGLIKPIWVVKQFWKGNMVISQEGLYG